MKPDKAHFKIAMPADLMAALKAIAVRESRSVSAQMIRMLRKQVQAEETTQE